MDIGNWRITDVDQYLLSPLGNLAGVAGGLVLLYVGLVRFAPHFRRQALLSPLSLRGARRAKVDAQTLARLRNASYAHAEGQPQRPGDVLGDLLRTRGPVGRPRPWGEWGTNLATWLHHVTRPDASSIAVKLVATEQTSRLEGLWSDIAEVVGRFHHVAPVPRSSALAAPHQDSPASSAHAASALTGAAVIVDAGGTRGKMADRVLVWHDTTFRDEHTRWSQASTYARAGAGVEVDDMARVGDYNGRLLELVGASLAANGRDGEVSFVLETAETSYQATEPPGELAGKGLYQMGDDPALPVFRTCRAEGKEERAEYLRAPYDQSQRERVCMVSAYVGILARGRDGDAGVVVHGGPAGAHGEGDVLVLCRRSTRTRHGAGTLSAAAGGVVELDQDVVRLDTDEMGVPSIDVAVMREMTEELGLPREQINAYPSAVWVATVRGTPARADRGAGQVVGSVMYLGTTALTLAEIQAGRHQANHARGAFEVDGLEAFALRPGQEGLDSFVAAVRNEAQRMDQTGLMSCFYAALRYWNLDVVGAFVRAFEVPWWGLAWQEDDQPDAPRVCRDARQVLPDEAEAITTAVPQWEQAWRALPRLLGSGGNASR